MFLQVHAKEDLSGFDWNVFRKCAPMLTNLVVIHSNPGDANYLPLREVT